MSDFSILLLLFYNFFVKFSLMYFVCLFFVNTVNNLTKVMAMKKGRNIIISPTIVPLLSFKSIIRDTMKINNLIEESDLVKENIITVYKDFVEKNDISSWYYVYCFSVCTFSSSSERIISICRKMHYEISHWHTPDVFMVPQRWGLCLRLGTLTQILMGES